jgi:hypothetical protein
LDLAHFDAAKFHVGAGLGGLHGFIEVGSFDYEESPHHFLGLGEWTIDDGWLSVAFSEYAAFPVGEFLAAGGFCTPPVPVFLHKRLHFLWAEAVAGPSLVPEEQYKLWHLVSPFTG